jgi:hypothetical protein
LYLDTFKFKFIHFFHIITLYGFVTFQVSASIARFVALLDILVSFDVTSLFPSVPLAPAIEHVENILHTSEVPPDATKEFLSLLGVCLSHDICKFKDEFHAFPDGLPMGSPLALLLADVFMSRLRTRFSLFLP